MKLTNAVIHLSLVSVRTATLLVRQTDEVSGTVEIRETTDWLSADSVWVTEEKWPTVAFLLMIFHRTDGILTATVLQTGVDALAINASLVQFTVTVYQTAFTILARTSTVWVTAKRT